MKKTVIFSLSIILFIGLIIACSNKEIRLVTNVDFTTTLTNTDEGFVNDLLPTTIIVTPQVILPEFSYFFKYELIEGSGSFQDENGTTIPAGEDLLLSPENDFSLFLDYKASAPGNNRIKITISDNFEKVKNYTLSYAIKNVDIVWRATTAVTQVNPGQKVPITIILENNTPERQVTFQRNYQYTQGTGSITDAEDTAVILGQFVDIIPGVYVIDVISNQIGTNTIIFNLEDSNGQEKSQSISFEVTEDVLASENDIIAFSIPGQTGASIIDPTTHTVTLMVPFDTPLNVAPNALTVSDNATVIPGITAVQDFSNVVTYNVTAENGDPQDWTVTVTVAPDTQSAENDIIAFNIPGQTGASNIDFATHTITLTVPFNTPLNVAPNTLTVSDNATVIPEVIAIQDFSNVVTYNVTAENGDPQDWTVTVTVAPDTQSAGNDIIAFNIPGQTGVSNIEPVTHTVSITVLFDTPLSVAPSTLTVSDNATINPAIGNVQDFSSPVSYAVTAENGDEQDWTVMVTVAPDTRSTENDIIAFSIPGQAGASTIDPVTHTVSITVSFDTPLTVAPNTFTISDNATINPAITDTQNFSSPVSYTVTAENETPQDWTVTVTVAPPMPTAVFSGITTVSVTFPNESGTLTITNGSVAFNVSVFGGSGGSSITFTIEGIDSYPVSAPANTPNSITTPLIPAGVYNYSLSGSFSGSSGNSGSVNTQ